MDSPLSAPINGHNVMDQAWSIIELNDELPAMRGIHDVFLERKIDIKNPKDVQRITNVKFRFNEESIDGKLGIVCYSYRTVVKERLPNLTSKQMEMQDVEITALKFYSTFIIKYKNNEGTEQIATLKVPIKTIDKQPEKIKPKEDVNWHRYKALTSAEMICRTYKAALDLKDDNHKCIQNHIGDLFRNNNIKVVHHPDPRYIVRANIKYGETSFYQDVCLVGDDGTETKLVHYEPWIEIIRENGEVVISSTEASHRQAHLPHFRSIAMQLRKQSIVSKDDWIRNSGELKTTNNKNKDDGEKGEVCLIS